LLFFVLLLLFLLLHRFCSPNSLGYTSAPLPLIPVTLGQSLIFACLSFLIKKQE
jgi:hypothetical protein